MGTAVSDFKTLGETYINDPQTGRSFRLKDVATITRGIKEPSGKLLFRDGKPAVGLGISNAIGGNVVNMGKAVKARMLELEKDRPIGIELHEISDQAVSVEASVSDFVLNVIIALAIVIGTLLVFMGLRSGILMGGILLVTVAGTLIGMWVYGLDMLFPVSAYGTN